MTSDNFFKQLGTSTVVYDYFHDNKLSDQPYTIDLKGFDALLLDLNIVLQEPVLNLINNQHEIEYGFFLKLKPKMWYNWHVDTGRLCTINMLVSNTQKSHSLFKTGNHVSVKQHEVIELEYQPKQMYLYNTSIEHAVVNLENTDRFIFSLAFKHEPAYNDILNLIK